MTMLARTMPVICQNMGKGNPNGLAAMSFTAGANAACQMNGMTSIHRYQ